MAKKKTKKADHAREHFQTELTIQGVPLAWEPASPDAISEDSATAIQAGSDPQIQQSAPKAAKTETGDVTSTVSEPAVAYAVEAELPLAHAEPGEGRNACWERLRKSARAAGMPRGQGPGTAYQYATEQVERLFQREEPPPEPEIVEPEPPGVFPEAPASVILEPEESEIADNADQGVSGLGDLPADWAQLPANASLQAEISWVSANRLRVRDGHGVDLSRALSPAPSYSALSWLETSILFPSKFADISVKATSQQDDEREHIRREKLAIEEVRTILASMLEEEDG